jgi:uncharacterized OsmC-like protein
MEEKTHRITVRLTEGYRFVAEFPDIPGAPAIHFDEPSPLGSGSAPSAAAVLGAAIGNCLAASLAFCLRRARFDVTAFEADVETHVAKNEHGRYRIHDVDVQLRPTIEGAGSFDRCADLFEDFCIVTASVQHGIPVRVHLEEAKKTAA